MDIQSGVTPTSSVPPTTSATPDDLERLKRIEVRLASGSKLSPVGKEVYFRLKQLRDTPPANPGYEVNTSASQTTPRGASAAAETFDPEAAKHLSAALPVAGAVAAPLLAGPLGLPASGMLGGLTASVLAGAGGAAGKTAERAITGQPVLTKEAAKDIGTTAATSAAGELLPRAVVGGVKAAAEGTMRAGGRVLDYLAHFQPGTTRALAKSANAVAADTLDSAAVKGFAQDVQDLLAQNHADIGHQMDVKAAQFDKGGNGKVPLPGLIKQMHELGDKLKIGRPGIRVVDEATESEMKAIAQEIRAEIGGKPDLALKDLLAIRRRLDNSLTSFTKGGAGVQADTKAFNPLRNWVDSQISAKYPTWKPLDAKYVQLINDQGLIERSLGIKPGVPLDDAALLTVNKKLQQTLKSGKIDEELMGALGNRLGDANLLDKARALGASTQLGAEVPGGPVRALTATAVRPVVQPAARLTGSIHRALTGTVPNSVSSTPARIVAQEKAKTLADSISAARKKDKSRP